MSMARLLTQKRYRSNVSTSLNDQRRHKSQPSQHFRQTRMLTALVPKQDGDSNTYQKLAKDPEVVTFLNQIGDYAVAQSNSPKMWDRRRKSVKLRKYILGEYYGIFDQKNGWVSAKDEGDGIYFDPQTATYIDDLLASLVKAKPKLQVEARDPERIDKKEAARVAEQLLERDDAEFSPKRQQREWKTNLLAAGETYRIAYFNKNKPGAGYSKPQYIPHEIQGGDKASYCPLCSSTTADETGKCANCKNPQMDEYQVQSTTIQKKLGTVYEQIGEPDYDVPDALEMTVIGDTDQIGEALIVLRQRMIPRCVLEDALGIENLPKTGTPETLSYKQLFSDNNTGSGLEGMEPLLFQELWVAPAVYAHYKFPKDTPTKGGQVMPEGVKGRDVCPDGFYFSRVEKRITQFFPQCAAECLSHAANSIGEGFHGQGEWDLAELQDHLTELKSLKMNSAMEDSTSPLLIRQGLADAENFENKPGLIVEVGQDFPSDQPLTNAMTRVPMAGLSSEVYGLSEEINGQMQHRVGAFSTQADAPDTKAMGTATGIATIDARSLGRRGPALALYAQMLVDHAYQRLEMRRKYWPQNMYSGVAKELGMDAVKWFMQSNVSQDFKISVIEDSWMPQTDMMKKAGFEAYAGLAMNVLSAKGDVQGLDELLRAANEVYQVGIDFGDAEAQSVEAQLRLDKLRDVAAFVEQQFGPLLFDPQTGQINEEALSVAYAQTAQMLRLQFAVKDAAAQNFADKPLDPMFDTHSEFEEAYTDWLRTADGRAASLFVRLAVRQLADYHVQAEAYRQMKIAEYSQLAQIPQAEGDLMMNEAQKNQENDQNAEQTAQAVAAQHAAPQPPPPPPEPQKPLNQHIAESINFKDLPPSGQVELANMAGLNISEGDVKAHIASQKPTPKPSAGASK
jgi:hypothetical protein